MRRERSPSRTTVPPTSRPRGGASMRRTLLQACVSIPDKRLARSTAGPCHHITPSRKPDASSYSAARASKARHAKTLTRIWSAVLATNSGRVATTGLTWFVGSGVDEYDLHTRTASKPWGGRRVCDPVNLLPAVSQFGSSPLSRTRAGIQTFRACRCCGCILLPGH